MESKATDSNSYQRWDIGFENIFSGILEDIDK
jgi:hypothetical protein